LFADYARYLSAMGAVTISVEDAGSADAQACIARYFADLQARFDAGYDPAKGLPAGADLLNPPQGFFLIARLDGVPVGCVGVKHTSAEFSEVKRMWVSPDARGLGLGRRLLEELERLAAADGVRLLRLDTNKTLTEARALYAACGYREIPDFNGEPYADFWFEKTLTPPG
jgi:GNAT superfamily N-acetyltransferase